MAPADPFDKQGLDMGGTVESHLVMLNRRAPVTCSPCLARTHDCAGACACPRCHPVKGPWIGSAQPTPPFGFNSVMVCQITGVTFRQLDYWARSGLVRPSIADARGSGTKRVYSAHDVALIEAVKAGLDIGLSLQRMREALPLIREAVLDGLAYVVIGQSDVVACRQSELAGVIRELGLATVLPLEQEVVAASP